jgi:putative PEP-CTERM system histidine kinase
VLSFGVISFGIAGAGFLVLTLLLAVGREGRSQGARLIGACAATALWAAIHAACAWTGQAPEPAVLAAECLRFGAWILLLDGVATAVGTPRARLLAMHGALAGVLMLVVAIVVLEWLRAWPGLVLRPTVLAGAVLAVFLLLYVGLVTQAARGEVRDALAWLLAALGLIVGYDLVVFALLHFTSVSVGPAWEIRGLINLLTLPMIVIAARRNPRWVPRLFVSRHVVFYGIAIAAGAAYFILVVILARLSSRHGGPWGGTAQVILLGIAIAAFVALLALPGLRQRLRVFITKHFYRSKYDYRAEWLRFIQTLSAAQLDPDPRGSAIRAIAQIISSPGAVLFQRGDQWTGFVPVCAWPRGHVDVSQLPSVPAEDEMVGFLEQRQWVIDLHELRSNPSLYGGIAVPAVFGTPGSARIILPLLRGNDLIGFVVLDDPATPFDPNYEDRDLLKTVGRHVATHLAQHDADRRLAESRQFEAFHRLTAFVMHDLKNLAAQLALIVVNAERHKQNPEFIDDVITTVANSTSRMQRLIEQLRGRDLPGLHRPVPLEEVAARACERCIGRRPQPQLTVEDAGLVVDADPDQLVTALEHLVRNAQDATPEHGSVAVTVRADGDGCLVIVADTGCGMTAEFIQERLFRPFDTTKGSQGMGIGAYQLREYVRSLGGAVEVTSTPRTGTTIEVRLQRRHA